MTKEKMTMTARIEELEKVLKKFKQWDEKVESGMYPIDHLMNVKMDALALMYQALSPKTKGRNMTTEIKGEKDVRKS